MRLTCRYLSLAVLTLLLTVVASAQSQIDVNVGFGAAQNKASSLGIDQTTFLACTPGSSPTCQQTPKLNEFMIGLGANLMLWEKFGVGMEATIQGGKEDYVNLPAIPSIGYPASKLQSRVIFYDFDAIYRPVKTEKVAVNLVGGIGGVNMRFYENFSSSSLLGSYNSSQYASSANHFQVRAGVGVQLYVSGNFFIRPQVDVRYVPNFEQFGRNMVTQEMVWVGYTIGER